MSFELFVRRSQLNEQLIETYGYGGRSQDIYKPFDDQIEQYLKSGHKYVNFLGMRIENNHAQILRILSERQFQMIKNGQQNEIDLMNLGLDDQQLW